MRILLIDCASTHLGQLESICARHEVSIVPLDNVSEHFITSITGQYDCLILAGSYVQSIVEDSIKYQELLTLVSTINIPIVGVGFGFEVVCYCLGAKLDTLAERGTGATVITATDDGVKIFQGSDPMHLQVFDRWLVEAEDLPKIMTVLASSDSGVEAIKHKTKPIYAIQMFPEEFIYPSDGKLVLENILSMFSKLSSGSRKLDIPQKTRNTVAA